MNKKVFISVFAGMLAFLFLSTLIIYWILVGSLSGICGTLDLDGLDNNYNNRVNVLLIGVDGSETRTDTIMLASLDFKNKSISLLSIPRDTRVKYRNSWDKITHLFSYDNSGGIESQAK